MINYKTKFADVPIGNPFLYNDIFYIKANEREGMSQRLGVFTIHPNEIVEIAHEVEKPKLKFFGPFGILLYLVACIPLFLLAIYFLVESL